MRPRPPERGQNQKSASQPAPCQVARQNRRDLGEPEDEDQIEEELERRDPLLALDVLVAHSQTLTRRGLLSTRPLSPSSRVAFEIVGREEELSSLRAFVGDAMRGPTMLVLEGEAGIGKSTLWDAGVVHARGQALTVLSSRPTESERGLGHVGLVDLLEGVVDDVLSALLAPRRRALEVALLREDASGDPVDRSTLAVAVRDVLQL